jgi:hypothetical protein
VTRRVEWTRLGAAWPRTVAEHATFDLKSAPRVVRT